MNRIDIYLIDGPYNDKHASLNKQPPRILIGGRHLYSRIDDPSTGLSLDAYVYEGLWNKNA